MPDLSAAGREPYNPYVAPSREASFYGGRWTPDGWGATCVLARWHQYDIFARYLAAVLQYNAPSKPTLTEIPRLSVLSYRSVHGRLYRGIRVVSASRQHLARMRVESVGRLALNHDAVAADFPPDQVIRWWATEFAAHADTSDRLAQAVVVDDPLTPYLA